MKKTIRAYKIFEFIFLYQMHGTSKIIRRIVKNMLGNRNFGCLSGIEKEGIHGNDKEKRFINLFNQTIEMNAFEIITNYGFGDYADLIKKEIKNEKEPQYKQDSNNCWIYSMFNNAYLNLGYKLSSEEIEEIKSLMKGFGIILNNGGSSVLGGSFVAYYLSNKLGKKIKSYNINCFKFPQDFAKLAKDYHYSFVINRIHTPQFIQDIDDNHVIEDVHSNKTKERHATNIIRNEKEKMFQELGTRGNSSTRNKFRYSTEGLIGNMKARSIDRDVCFLGFNK